MSTRDDEFIQEVANKYLRHLGSIHRLRKTYNIEKENEESELEIGGIVAHVLYIKFNIHDAEQKKDWGKVNDFNNKLKELIESPLLKMIDKNTKVYESENEISVSIESSLLRRAYIDYQNNTLDSAYDDSQFQNSLIVSLVIGLEILIAELIKDFVQTLDISEQILKDKKIDYKLLKEIGSVEEAKLFLIDQYIEQLLRDTFDNWITELKKKANIDIINNTCVKNDIKLINETIQRRHLIVHNDGIVNDLYLNKIDESLRWDVSKGETLSSDQEYIESRVSTFRKFGLILIYLYGLKKNRNRMDEFFLGFHGLLVQYLERDYEASRYIFDDWARNEKLSIEYQAMCKVNYFLTYKLNNDHSIDKELKEFDAEKYGDQFILAKDLMLGSESAGKDTMLFLKEMNDDDFINALTWPLFKLVKKDEEFKDFVKKRIDMITEKEMESELVENK